VAGGDYNLGTAHGTIELNAASLGRASGALDHVANRMLLVGGAAAAGLGYAIKSAGDFEQQMSRFQAVADATKSQMDGIRKKALQLGQDSAYGATEVINAFAELGYAGITTKEILGGVGDAVVYLAAAAEIPLKDAATALVNTMRQFGIPAKGAVDAVNELARAANASTIDMADLITSLRYAGPLAAALNIPLKDVAATLAILGNNGIRGSTAGTSLRGILIALTPTSLKAQAEMEKLGLITGGAGQTFLDAAGNVLTLEQATALAAATFKHKTAPSAETLQKDFKKLGLTAQEGNNIFFDANGKLKSMAEVSQILHDHTVNLTDEQKKLAFTIIFQRRAMASAIVLAKDGAGAYDKLTHSAQYNVTAQELMKKKLDNMKGAFKILKASVETFAITIGSVLTPFLKDAGRKLTEFTNWLIRLSPETKKWIVLVVGSVAGLLLFAGAVLKIGKATIGMYKALKDLGAGLKIVSEILKTQLLANPWILALIGIALAIIYLYTHSAKFRKFVDDFVKKLGELEVAFATWIGNTVGSPQAKKFLKDFLLQLGGLEVGVVKFFGDTFGSAGAKKFLHDFLHTLGSVEVGFADFMLKTFGSHTAKVFLHDFLDELGHIEVGLFLLGKKFVTFWASYAAKFISGLSDLVSKIIEWDVKMLKAGYDLLKALADGIIQGWVLTYNFFVNLPNTIKNFFIDASTWLLQHGIDLIVGLVNGVGSALGQIGTAMFGIFLTVMNGVKDAATWLIDAGEHLVHGMWKGIKKAAGWLIDKIKGWVGDIVGAVEDFFGVSSPSKVFAEIGGHLVRGLAKGIADNAKLAHTAIQDLMPKVDPSLAFAISATNPTRKAQGPTALSTALGVGAVSPAGRSGDRVEQLLSQVVDHVKNMEKPLVGELNVLPGRQDPSSAGFEAVRQLKAARFRTGK
jgi:TP901 family phage tail tape measure protein